MLSTDRHLQNEVGTFEDALNLIEMKQFLVIFPPQGEAIILLHPDGV